MRRRILLLGLLAVTAQLSTGCFPCVRQRIAARWHGYHGCGPVCCAPSFKVPAVGPVGYGPPPGCATCAPGGGLPTVPVVYTGAEYPAYPTGGVPILSAPRPIQPGVTIEQSGVPGVMPPKTPN